MENYFNYFTDIEERFQRRRGTLLLLSTLDWALIETWKDAGLPLEAVLRGIDAAFDKYDSRPTKSRKVNSLAYCSQAVLAAAEELKEAATGTAREPSRSGLERERVVAFLEKNAGVFAAACQDAPRKAQAQLPQAAATLVREYAGKLLELARQTRDEPSSSLEELERRLTVMEEKLFAALLAGSSDDLLVEIRAQAERELAPYRGKMTGPQIEQLLKQCVNKRLLDRYALPRLSLFYM